MANIENSGENSSSILLFRDLHEAPSTDEELGAHPAQDYWRARERVELAAARRATLPVARHLHLELAKIYGLLLREAGAS